MMFLTFGEKCGGFGASAFTGGSVTLANNRSLKREASAIVRKPVLHSLKKCRRVIAARISELNAIVQDLYPKSRRDVFKDVPEIVRLSTRRPWRFDGPRSEKCLALDGLGRL